MDAAVVSVDSTTFPGRNEPPRATDLLELWGGESDNLPQWAGGVLERLEAGEDPCRTAGRATQGG